MPKVWKKHALGCAALLAALLQTGTPGEAKEKPMAPPPTLKQSLDLEPSPEPPSSRRETDRERHLARQAIERESYYDTGNPDLGKLQTMDEASRHMPYDANGFPDWMRSLREGVIKPRTSLKGDKPMETLDLDIIMRNTKEMPYVRFPHNSHTLWLACSNCHPAPFAPKTGGNAIRMGDIFRGKFCGMCHDRVAFITFFSCVRCHSVPQGTPPAQ